MRKLKYLFLAISLVVTFSQVAVNGQIAPATVVKPVKAPDQIADYSLLIENEDGQQLARQA